MKIDIKPDVFDTFVDPVCIIGSDLRSVYFNPSFSNLIEESSIAAVKKKPVTDFITLEDFDWERLKLACKAYLDSPIREVIYRTKNHTGKVQLAWRSVKDSNGDYNVLIYFRDVSLEETLSRKYKEELSKKEETIKALDQHLFQVSLIRDVLQRTNTFDDPLVMLRNLYSHLIGILNIDFALYFKQEFKGGPLQLLAQSDNGTIVGRDVRNYSEEIKSKLSKEQHYNEILDNYFWIDFHYKDDSELEKYFVFVKNKEFTYDEQNLLETLSEPLSFSLDNRDLFKKAMTDEMTALYNHRYFKVRLESEIRDHADRKKTLGLLLLDIDHFKKFNDTYGHLTGDKVLKEVASCIKDMCRSTDVPARYGGEEFACILPDIAKDDIMTIAERIRKGIEKTLIQTDEFGVLKVTASIGISHFPKHGDTIKGLISSADSALYEAKRAGRNNCKIKN